MVAVAEPPHVAYTGPGAVIDYAELQAAIEEQARAQLAEAVALVPDDIRTEATLVSGNPVEKLADAGRTSGSVLILGSRAYGPVRRVVLGSVSAALMRSAPCPVIVHPRGTRSEFAAGEATTAQVSGGHSESARRHDTATEGSRVKS